MTEEFCSLTAVTASNNLGKIGLTFVQEKVKFVKAVYLVFHTLFSTTLNKLQWGVN